MDEFTKVYEQRMKQVKDGMTNASSALRAASAKRNDAMMGTLCYLGATAGSAGVGVLSVLTRTQSRRPATSVARFVICGASLIGGMAFWSTLTHWRRYWAQTEGVCADVRWNFQEWMMLEDEVILAMDKDRLGDSKLNKRFERQRAKQANIEQLVTALQPPRFSFFGSSRGVAK